MLGVVIWQLNDDLSSLKIAEWDGEFTVFQLASGKTHFLNEMGLKILTILDQSPATLQELCQQLSEYFTLPLEQQFSEQIMKTLLRYEVLGLVSRA